MTAADLAYTPARRRIDLARVALIGVVVFATACVAVLLATILWLSFTSGTPGDPSLGYTWGNYAEVLNDSFTWRVLGNTVLFLIVTLVVAFALALPLAWLAERTDIPRLVAQHTAEIFTSGQFLGLMLVIIVGVLVVTNEYTHQTATATFLTTPRRAST